MRRGLRLRQSRLMAGAWLTLGAAVAACGEAAAAGGQMFPVGSHLVAVVVAAAFILPAGIAGVASLVKRAGRSPAGLLGVGLLAIGAVAVVALANPGMLASLRV